MPQKPIRLKQLGINLDEIIVHLQNVPYINTEINEKTVKKLIVSELAKNSEQNLQEIKKMVKDVSEQTTKHLITKEVNKQLPKIKPKTKPQRVAATVEEYKLWAKQEIDQMAGITRNKYITLIPGQESLYAEKVEEATDYIIEKSITLSSFPLLQAEVTATGKTANEVAEGILEKKSQWISINAKIEEIRLRGKQLIDSPSIIDESGVDHIKKQSICLLDKL